MNNGTFIARVAFVILVILFPVLTYLFTPEMISSRFQTMALFGYIVVVILAGLNLLTLVWFREE